MTNKKTSFNLSIWLIFGLLCFLAFREFYFLNVAAYVGIQNIWHSRRFILFLTTALLSTISWCFAGFKILRSASQEQKKTKRTLPHQFALLLALSVILLPGFVKWILPLPENIHIGFLIEFFLIFSAALSAAYLLVSDSHSDWDFLVTAGVWMLLAGANHSILYKFNFVTDYPFTLYWSEGNRFFDYSTLFGSARYILPQNETINAFISWGMQLPWALPFLLPNLGIGFFRFWYQCLWIIPSFILGLVLINKKQTGMLPTTSQLVFAFWVFLFLDQGPIYAPLLIGAVITVLSARSRLSPGILMVAVAAFYVHNSRWTWSYAPGLWAGMVSLLDLQFISFSRDGLEKLIKPVALGLAGYFGGQLLPSLIRVMAAASPKISLLPNPAASTTRQPLLWDRLWPNPTYPPGIFWGLVWAALPLILLLISLVVKKVWKIHWLQQLSILSVAAAFLVVGLIASMKIGGGSNLHNLDMFLVTLVLIAASAFNQISKAREFRWGKFPIITILMVLIVVTPTTYALREGGRLKLTTPEKTSESLSMVQKKVIEYSTKGEVLFIDHRQLLTFGIVQNVPLVDDYEKKYLMDQAMADNNEYFQTFYKDLFSHRFALIVNEPTNIVIRGSEYSFGEENDAYVKWVTTPLLCAYEPLFTSQETSLELLIPRQSQPPAYLNCEKFNSS